MRTPSARSSVRVGNKPAKISGVAETMSTRSATSARASPARSGASTTVPPTANVGSNWSTQPPASDSGNSTRLRTPSVGRSSAATTERTADSRFSLVSSTPLGSGVSPV
ncbi:Uncharacterised protein [Mycobacteroides abscessus subsp. abscessus]|nr:Uncharacterised protein [Mycobacteroides abscessus subsp. abscessus]